MRALVVAIVVAWAVPAGAEPRMWKLPALVAIKDVKATSTLAAKQDAYAAWRAVGYDVRSDMANPEPVVWSAWCEGKPDEGLGETVTITLAEPTQLDAVRIAAGVWRTDKLFKANNQITAIDVIVDGGTPVTAKPVGKAWIEVKLGAKVTTLAFRIGAVKKGKMNDSCIAGIDLMRGGHRLAPVLGVAAKGVAGLQAQVTEIQAALGAPKKRGLDKLIELPFENYNVELMFGYGGGPETAASFKQLLDACAAQERAMKASNGDPIPTACPAPVWIRDGEQDLSMYDGAIRIEAPGKLEIAWPAGREFGVVWHLHYTDRWRLTSSGVSGIGG